MTLLSLLATSVLAAQGNVSAVDTRDGPDRADAERTPLQTVIPEYPRAAWLDLWDRRDLLTPFPQLDREVYTFQPKELTGRRFTFRCGGLIPHRSLRGYALCPTRRLRINDSESCENECGSGGWT